MSIPSPFLRGAALFVALAALCGVALPAARAERPVSVQTGGLQVTFKAGFSPEAAARTVPTPVAFGFAAKVRMADGSQPPPLSALTFETDRNAVIDLKGLPVCAPFLHYDGHPLLERCKAAAVGSGTAEVQIQFPEQAPVANESRLVIYNGGVKAGVKTLYAAFYLTVPTPASIISRVTIEKVHNGRFGTRTAISIPKIAGGSGSITDFSAVINRKSVVTLECPDGKVQTRAEAVFANGIQVEAALRPGCVPKRAVRAR
jgi:hypothetical protein